MFELINDSFNVIKKDSSKLKKVIIGTALILFSWLILPMLIYQGYLIRILKDTENGLITELPSWSNTPQLLINGLLAIMISIMISIPSLILNIIPMFTESLIVVLIIGNLGTVLSFVTSYLTTAIITVYFRDGLSEAMNLGRLKNILLSIEYLTGFMLTFILGFIFGILFLLVSITIIGILFIPPMIVVLMFMSTMIMGVSITRAEKK